jgi:hypothetical protein
MEKNELKRSKEGGEDMTMQIREVIGFVEIGEVLLSGSRPLRGVVLGD